MRGVLTWFVAFACLAAFIALGSPAVGPARAQTVYQVGQTVSCEGPVGRIIRIEPRPSWDEPFYILHVKGESSIPYELKCLPKWMKLVASASPSTADAVRAPVQPAGALASATGTYRVGETVSCEGPVGRIIRIEPRPGWDEPFYVLEVRGESTTYEVKCLSKWMKRASPPKQAASSSRAGTASVARPASAQGYAPPKLGRAPDGTYECHKISNHGTFIHVGTLKMRAGKGQLIGMPQGWTVRDIYVRGRGERGERIVAFDYRSAAGWSDSLDCTPK